METFAPSANGLRLQRFYPFESDFQVEEDPRELGNVKSVAIAEKPLRFFDLTYHVPTREGAEYIQSFFNRHVGPAGRFLFQLPEYVPSPDLGPTLVAVAGGSQAQRTVFVKFAWKNASGITRASAATSLVVPLNNLLKVTLPQPYPPSVTQSVIYATQGSAGTEVEQTTLTSVRTWTQPDAALLTGTAAPQTVNGCLEVVTAKLRQKYRIVRGHGLTYQVTLPIEEAY